MNLVKWPVGVIALAGALLWQGTASAAEPGKPGVPRKGAVAATRASPAPAPAVAAAPVPAQEPTVAAVSVPACARKVKVIYSGYGEADRASCALASVEPAR